MNGCDHVCGRSGGRLLRRTGELPPDGELGRRRERDVVAALRRANVAAPEEVRGGRLDGRRRNGRQLVFAPLVVAFRALVDLRWRFIGAARLHEMEVRFAVATLRALRVLLCSHIFDYFVDDGFLVGGFLGDYLGFYRAFTRPATALASHLTGNRVHHGFAFSTEGH